MHSTILNKISDGSLMALRNGGEERTFGRLSDVDASCMVANLYELTFEILDLRVKHRQQGVFVRAAVSDGVLLDLMRETPERAHGDLSNRHHKVLAFYLSRLCDELLERRRAQEQQQAA